MGKIISKSEELFVWLRSVCERAKAMVENRASNLGSLNNFTVAATLSFLRATRRRQIDRAFKAMSKDADFRSESLLISKEFENCDWEAFQLSLLATERSRNTQL